MKLNILNEKNIDIEKNFIGLTIGSTIKIKDKTYLIIGGSTIDGKPMLKHVIYKGNKKIWIKKKNNRFKKIIHGAIISEKVKVLDIKQIDVSIPPKDKN